MKTWEDSVREAAEHNRAVCDYYNNLRHDCLYGDPEAPSMTLEANPPWAQPPPLSRWTRFRMWLAGVIWPEGY